MNREQAKQWSDDCSDYYELTQGICPADFEMSWGYAIGEDGKQRRDGHCAWFSRKSTMIHTGTNRRTQTSPIMAFSGETAKEVYDKVVDAVYFKQTLK